MAGVIDKYAAGMYKRQEQYAQRVKGLYDIAVGKLTALAAQIPYDPDHEFSFSDNPRIADETTRIIRELYSQVYNQIKSGVEAEWNLANLSCDALITSIFGAKIKETNLGAQWFARNQKAMDAFFARKSANEGLNLSQKVWKYTGGLRTELENAISVSLGEGVSAATMSRRVRQYLREPDKLFRRVRGKDGKLHLSKAAKAYHPSRGVYRSSYKNAMRLTRTETNMAYRMADEDRWQRMDFVVGYEVKTSNNHPVPDICDDLKGKYPKGFVFKGWHPQCRCRIVPILATKGEFINLQKIAISGGDARGFVSKNHVASVPSGFTKWIKKNEKRILAAKSKPYFIRDNFIGGDIRNGLTNAVLKAGLMPKNGQLPTIKNVKIEPTASDDRKRLQERLLAQVKPEWTTSKDFAHRLELLDKAVNNKQAIPTKLFERVYNEAKSGVQTMAALERRAAEMAKWQAEADKVLEFKGKYIEVDTTKLESLMKYRMHKASGEIARLEQELAKIEQFKADVADLIPEAEANKYLMMFTRKEIEDCYNPVKANIEKIIKVHGSDLHGIKNELEYEAGWVKAHPKYATSSLAQKMYERKAAEVQKQIDWKGIKDGLAQATAFKTKAAGYKALLAELKDAIQNDDMVAANSALAKIQSKQFEILSKKAKKAQAGLNSDMESYAAKNYRTNFVSSQREYDEMTRGLDASATHVWNAAPTDVREAFVDYCDGDSTAINVAAGKGNITEQIKKLDSVFDQIVTTEDIVCRSGQNYSVAEFIFGGEFKTLLESGNVDELNRMFAGSKGVNKSFMSTSFNERGGFTKQFEFHVYAPKGSSLMNVNELSPYGRHKGVSWDGISSGGSWMPNGETEILLARGCVFKFIKAEAGAGKGGTTRVYIQIVGRQK